MLAYGCRAGEHHLARIEPTVARKVTRMRRGKEEGGKKEGNGGGGDDDGGGCIAGEDVRTVLPAPSEVGPSMAFKVSHSAEAQRPSRRRLVHRLVGRGVGGGVGRRGDIWRHQSFPLLATL